MTDVHLINHTHWDREWFLTHEYTTAWVPALIESLTKLAEQNPAYEYLFDGQTLAIEDLLGNHPGDRERVRRLIAAGNVTIGPCYSQPDWRMVSGELHVRNLQHGLADAASLGGRPDVAWLVDTFGHISQAPQLLAQIGLRAAYVWRGVPVMHPVFRWTGSDGTELTTIDLFGGYRNLYGITNTPDIAVHRLVAETDKLAPHYNGLPVPLFDGYDLDTEPEDPARYYEDLDVPSTINLIASSPSSYVDAIQSHVATAPALHGELISGKYGSTFPGSLSARTYLKVQHHDCELSLHRRVEPVLAIAATVGHRVDREELERASRTLLQNGVHDCICGVSIDQVHERMERSYRAILARGNELVESAASAIFDGFAPGRYALSTSTVASSSVQRVAGDAALVETNGYEITRVERSDSVRSIERPVEVFSWHNDHFDLVVDRTGFHVAGSADPLLRLVVRRDDGDTYSSEPGDMLGELHLDGEVVHVDESDLDATVRTTWRFESDELSVSAVVDARFDSGPLVDLTMALDSTGVGFRLDAHVATGLASPTVHAGMPFDVVERTHDDDDLFEFDIDPALAAVLMGQREVDWVTEFPFHDFVAMHDDAATRAVLAKGPRAYRSQADGTISIALRRSVEWLAKTGLRLRSGDAGPAMYVPGARCERTVTHRLAVAFLSGPLEKSGLAALNDAWQNPPMLVDVDGGAGSGTDWSLASFGAPTTATVPQPDGRFALRVFNPSNIDHELGHQIERVALSGEPLPPTDRLSPKEIATLPVSVPSLPTSDGTARVTVLNPFVERVPRTRVVPTDGPMQTLRERIAELEGELVDTRATLAENEDRTERYFLQHREYVLDRERLEMALSLELNERRAATDDEVSIPDDPDPVIAELGADLNDLRVKRRIFDYVVQALAD